MNPSRRSFLSRLVFGREPAVSNPGQHTLVCVFLRGAADTLNMLVPYGDRDYYANRPTLSIAEPGKGKDASIRLDDFYAFHPKMAPLVPVFREGRLGMVQAVGSDNPTGSHFEAQDQIEHGESYGNNLGGGWLGRHLRSRFGDLATPLSGVAIGATLPESLRGAAAASAFHSIDEIHLAGTGNEIAISRALSAMYATQAGVLGRQGDLTLDLLRRVEAVRGKPYQPEAGASYPADDFGTGLREIARLAKADLGLEVACIDLGGWDTHFFQGTTGGQQAGLIDTLARGLAAFDADLVARRERVTTIVMTEFGRRLYENGSAGTDHGRGFAFFAMGQKIHGGKVHGAWPGLQEEPSLPGPGGMQVLVDYRSVLSEVLVNAAGNRVIDQVFPGFRPGPVGLVL
ncbi:MAG TPA: DUF1501 domain-containing protein [Tepidisphaeraceae bacterium]|nr:DUF1501 domain-containing protein [Tepidisphaeraceae bacterium]